MDDSKFNRFHRFLDEVRQHGTDPLWVRRNRTKIRQNLYDGFESEETVSDAVWALTLLYPQMMKAGQNELARAMLNEAHIRMPHMTEQQKSTIWLLKADFERRMTQFYPAQQIYMRTESLAVEHQFRDVLLEVAIGRLRLTMQEQGQSVDIDVVRNALDLADDVQDDILTAQLYQALNYCYANAGDVKTSLYYGNLAIEQWERTDYYDATEQMAEIAYMMASACTQLSMDDPDVHDAMEYLEWASALYLKTNNHSQYAKFAYLYGAIKRMHSKYDEAAQWLFKALNEYQMLDPAEKSPYREACIYHVLGVSLTHTTKQISQAEFHLLSAMDLWTELEDYLQVASVYNDLGRLQEKLGKEDVAEHFYHLALEELQALEETERSNNLLQIVNANLGRLDSNG